MQHIALLGLMGSGKSTAGERLAKAIKRPFLDVDTIIVAEHGPIPQLFTDLGEDGFRRLEEEVLRNVLTREPMVISPGGGAITYEPSRLLLAQTTRVYLDVPLKTLVRRLSHSATVRPLVGKRPTIKRVTELWEARHGWYEEAEIRIVGDASLERVVNQIVQALEKRGGMTPA